MNYSEENGQVVLRMSREDYEMVLQSLGALMILRMDNRGEMERLFGVLNRLNEGNPNYTPPITCFTCDSRCRKR
jgi:hypothetical protein